MPGRPLCLFLLLLLCLLCACGAMQTLPSKRRHPRSYAQAEEDLFLYENYFWNKKNGIIAESGALDGIKFSTTLFFQNTHQWTPIHIEASPVNYFLLQKNRGMCLNINAALCSSNSMVHFLDGKPKIGGRASCGIAEFMSQEFAKRFHPEFYALNQTSQSNRTAVFDTMVERGFAVHAVPCYRMSDIVLGKTSLTAQVFQHIDIWVLDIEGAELSALQGTDLTAVSISVILVETPKSGVSLAADYLQNTYNYSCARFKHNYACHHPSFTPSVSLKSSLTSW